MRLGVTGSRHWTDKAAVWAALDAIQPKPKALVHGGARGVDSFAASWARARKVITICVLPADANAYHSYIRRNHLIVDISDQVLAFRSDGKSNGTDRTMLMASEAGKLLGVVMEEVGTVVR